MGGFRHAYAPYRPTLIPDAFGPHPTGTNEWPHPPDCPPSAPDADHLLVVLPASAEPSVSCHPPAADPTGPTLPGGVHIEHQVIPWASTRPITSPLFLGASFSTIVGVFPPESASRPQPRGPPSTAQSHRALAQRSLDV